MVRLAQREPLPQRAAQRGHSDRRERPRCPVARPSVAGLPRIPDGQVLDLLGGRPALAAGSRAEEPADGQPDHHPLAADRRVGQPPSVAAVHPARHRSARRARRRARPALAGAGSSPAATTTCSTITPARCGRRIPSSTTPGNDKHPSPCDNYPTPGRTAGLANRRTTRSPFASHSKRASSLPAHRTGRQPWADAITKLGPDPSSREQKPLGRRLSRGCSRQCRRPRSVTAVPRAPGRRGGPSSRSPPGTGRAGQAR